MNKLKLGIMLSGSGTTYEFLAQAIADQRLQAEVVRVVSSSPKAGGIERAKKFNHPVSVIDPKDPKHHDEITRLFKKDDVDLVAMAGYLHLWKLPSEFYKKTINTHPSLIPAFCGKGMYGNRVHEAVVQRGVRLSGCTIHRVDGQYDQGTILEQRSVAVESGDTAQIVAQKVMCAEKSLLLHVITHWNFYPND